MNPIIYLLEGGLHRVMKGRSNHTDSSGRALTHAISRPATLPLWRPSKPLLCWYSLDSSPSEYSQMSTHLPGFQSFVVVSSFFLHDFVLAKLATSSIRVKEH